MARTGRLYGCPVELTLGLVGGKWKTIILARLKEEPMRYGELRAVLPGMSDKVLTQRLRDLGEAGFIASAAGADGRTRYGLTDRGRSLQPVLEALYAWGKTAAEGEGARFRTPPSERGG